MSAIGSTNSATPSVQTSLMRSRLEAAKREADQAQNTEQRLRHEMQTAESKTQQSQGKVRTLSLQANQSEPTYAAHLQRQHQTFSATEIQPWLSGLYNGKQIRTLGINAGQYLNMNV